MIIAEQKKKKHTPRWKHDNKTHCLIQGDFVNGFKVWGPFDDENAARIYAANYLPNASVVPMIEPGP